MPVSGAATFMISVRNELGVAVGHADGLTEERVSFHVNVPLGLGEKVEFRLELPGADDTVLGWLVVESGQGPPGTLVHYRGRVAELDPGDVACFQRWVQAVREGHVALDLRGDSKRQGAFVTMHGATDEETQTALRRMDERRSRLSRITQVAPVSEEPTDEIFIACAFESVPVGTVPIQVGPTPPVPAPPAPSSPALAARPDRESSAEARARLLHELLAEADARTRSPGAGVAPSR
ncbi:hypothetical protein L6R53_32710 [Myxococcota bacterium]|nr:hypothetical protein [Myxococcota bacterium]